MAYGWTTVKSWWATATTGAANYIKNLNWAGAGAWAMSMLKSSLVGGWGGIKAWWEGGWPGLIAWVKTLSWSDVGMFIADRLTFGLASKINGANWGGIIKGALAAGQSAVSGWGAGTIAATGKPAPVGGNRAAPAVAGRRAFGGPVRAGKTYLVGERGRELFTPNVGGSIVPNHKLSQGQSGEAPGARGSSARPPAQRPMPFPAMGRVPIRTAGAPEPLARPKAAAPTHSATVLRLAPMLIPTPAPPTVRVAPRISFGQPAQPAPVVLPPVAQSAPTVRVGAPVIPAMQLPRFPGQQPAAQPAPVVRVGAPVIPPVQLPRLPAPSSPQVSPFMDAVRAMAVPTIVRVAAPDGERPESGAPRAAEASRTAAQALALKVIMPSATQAAMPAAPPPPQPRNTRQASKQIVVQPGGIVINGVSDAQDVERAVERVLSRIAGANDRYYTD